MLRIIAGKFKGRKIFTPGTEATRPTQSIVREALFNICQGSIAGAKVLDAFAGSGAIGIEALSRGAERVTFIEKNPKALFCLQKNLQSLELENESVVLKMPFEKALEAIQEEKFDLIYVDPPYRQDPLPILEKIVALHLLSPTGDLFLESSFTASFQELDLRLKSSRRFAASFLHHFETAEH